MKLAIASLMLLAATIVIALPTPEQAQPDSCIIYKSEVDGSIQKRCPIGLEARSAEETSCIIYRNEVDGSVEKRCPPPLKARSEEVSSCIAREVDGVVDRRDPIPGTQNCI